MSCPAGDTWGFSLEGAQHLRLPDQPTVEPLLQDPTLIHLRGIEPLLYPLTSSLPQAAVRAAPAGRKTTTCAEQTKNSAFV